ncbi:uncharacterized protein LOC135926265 [Gordionus sp. m RMFG-2023]|uniref:uncharacterized protein LOC135926265 n=1 Tax=Gordionus sp. m RMFG-2023 TaxID=3053472 RepID=UPI0031FC10F2
MLKNPYLRNKRVVGQTSTVKAIHKKFQRSQNKCNQIKNGNSIVHLNKSKVNKPDSIQNTSNLRKSHSNTNKENISPDKNTYIKSKKIQNKKKTLQDISEISTVLAIENNSLIDNTGISDMTTTIGGRILRPRNRANQTIEKSISKTRRRKRVEKDRTTILESAIENDEIISTNLCEDSDTVADMPKEDIPDKIISINLCEDSDTVADTPKEDIPDKIDANDTIMIFDHCTDEPATQEPLNQGNKSQEETISSAQSYNVEKKLADCTSQLQTTQNYNDSRQEINLYNMNSHNNKSLGERHFEIRNNLKNPRVLLDNSFKSKNDSQSCILANSKGAFTPLGSTNKLGLNFWTNNPSEIRHKQLPSREIKITKLTGIRRSSRLTPQTRFLTPHHLTANRLRNFQNSELSKICSMRDLNLCNGNLDHIVDKQTVEDEIDSKMKAAQQKKQNLLKLKAMQAKNLREKREQRMQQLKMSKVQASISTTNENFHKNKAIKFVTSNHPISVNNIVKKFNNLNQENNNAKGNIKLLKPIKVFKKSLNDNKNNIFCEIIDSVRENIDNVLEDPQNLGNEIDISFKQEPEPLIKPLYLSPRHLELEVCLQRIDYPKNHAQSTNHTQQNRIYQINSQPYLEKAGSDIQDRLSEKNSDQTKVSIGKGNLGRLSKNAMNHQDSIKRSSESLRDLNYCKSDDQPRHALSAIDNRLGVPNDLLPELSEDFTRNAGIRKVKEEEKVAYCGVTFDNLLRDSVELKVFEKNKAKRSSNYDISDFGSDQSSEDEANPKKPKPNWAFGPSLKESAMLQEFAHGSLTPTIKYFSDARREPKITSLFVNKKHKKIPLLPQTPKFTQNGRTPQNGRETGDFTDMERLLTQNITQESPRGSSICWDATFNKF